MNLVTTSCRELDFVVWYVWLLVTVITLLQPSMLPEYGADSVARGASVVLAETPRCELFPWWPRFRWRKRALAAYRRARRRWRRARRQAWRAAQLARLALAGTITCATVVDWLTKWQLRRQLGALPVLYAVLDVLQVQSIIDR